MVLNMAILIYLANQNIFYKRGVEAQMGYVGQWIELNSKRTRASKHKETKWSKTLGAATFKREIPGLQ